MFASGFTWFNLIRPVGHDTWLAGLGVDPGTSVLLAHAMLASVLLIGLAVLGRVALERVKAKQGLERYFADETFTVRTGLEVYATGVKSVMQDMMSGADTKIFFPLVATLFLYIFVNNLFGLVPGMAPPTDNINTNVGMALIVFLVFNTVGLMRDPVGYIKHLMGPMLAVAPLLFVVEVIGLVFRPVTLSLRLTGNMFGDHTVFSVMSSLVPIGVPALFLGLALFVSFMQAFIFSLLTTMYVAMAVPHEEHEEH